MTCYALAISAPLELHLMFIRKVTGVLHIKQILLLIGITLHKRTMHFIAHTAATVLNNPLGIGTLSVMLVTVPIIGMDLVHKHGWEHWEPFAKHHK